MEPDVANYLIGLREGLEATLVVSILVAFLVKSRPPDRLPQVWARRRRGACCSRSASAALLTYVAAGPAGRSEQRELFEAVTSVAAVVFVTWMIFWMRRAARSHRQASCAASSTDALGLGALRGRRDGVPRRGPRGAGDGAALLRRRPGRDHDGRPAARHLARRARPRSRSAGCSTPAPCGSTSTMFFRWTGAAADPGRRRHLQVRRARLPGGRRPARPDDLRLRHLRRARPEHLVRRPARRHVQLHRRSRACWRSSPGSPTPYRSSCSSCWPSRRRRRRRPHRRAVAAAAARRHRADARPRPRRMRA